MIGGRKIMTDLTFGETTICKWKEGKVAAYSIGGDDCLRSQLYFAIPEMDKRGIRGNWWVNPGRGGSTNFKNQDDAWAQCWLACYDDWKAAADRGHDFGNHTLHHLGAATYTEAEQEIAQTAEIIWQTNPRQRLQLFLKGGGTHWGIGDDELAEILAKYDCVRGRGGGIEDPTWEVNPSADTLRGYVNTAIQERSWHLVGFHGIGPNCEWGGPVDGDAFIALLDYLVEKREQVWCGTHTEVHKYDQERSTASVQILEASHEQVCLDLVSAKDPRLYDYPLTLRTRLTVGKKIGKISQNGITLPHRTVAEFVQFEAIPGKGDIIIKFAQPE
jgi:beta-galactosidase